MKSHNELFGQPNTLYLYVFIHLTHTHTHTHTYIYIIYRNTTKKMKEAG